MAVPDPSIDPKIMESARREFLKTGFEKTMLKDICDGAGITTGALYKRYKGKEELFCAVVEQTVQDLYKVANERGNRDTDALSDSDLIKAWHMDEEDILAVLDAALYEFPVSEISVGLPPWVEALESEHWLRQRFEQDVNAAALEVN